MPTILYGSWAVTLPDEKYQFDPDDITNNEWRGLQQELGGMSFADWLTGIDDRDPKPCDVLIWFLRRKAGLPPQDLLAIDYPIRRLILEPLEVDDDPEAPAGSGPATSVQPSGTTESGPEISAT